MDLKTTYLGMRLRTPLVVSASPLSEGLDAIRRMEDAGAAAIVLYSLFEEQLTRESQELEHHLTHGTESFAEALTYFPAAGEFHLGPEGYLDHIRRAKEAVEVPIIGSLNGSTAGGWTAYARQIEAAGADALELNIYSIPTNAYRTGAEVEEACLEILKQVKAEVRIPVAVKLSPFYSNMAYMARRLAEAGADGLVLFNRFYQPDINLEQLEVQPHIILSTPMALRLPMRWIALLHGRVGTSLAATSGIHTSQDVLKMVMAGADVTMLCSTLYRHGIEYIRTIEREMVDWMTEHEYDSIEQMHGSMSQHNCPDPTQFERAQYIKTLHSFKAATDRA
ncbi:MAG: dihydroorotate dehydrogenase-like protein [Blastocatellia bacterium]|jgi:dihydroorotate dehydrogenase (fumarate)